MIGDINMVNQSCRVKFHQYLQWRPTYAEYQTFLSRGNNDGDIFIPKFIPSNTLDITSEEVECRNGYNGLHLLTNSSMDIWGEQVELQDSDISFGISMIFDLYLSAAFILHKFPFDCQSINVFFESLTTTDFIVLKPYISKPNSVAFELSTMASGAEYKYHSPVVEFNAFAYDDDDENAK